MFILRKLLSRQVATCDPPTLVWRRPPYRYYEVPASPRNDGHYCPDHDCGAEAIDDRCPCCLHLPTIVPTVLPSTKIRKATLMQQLQNQLAALPYTWQGVCTFAIIAYFAYRWAKEIGF